MEEEGPVMGAFSDCKDDGLSNVKVRGPRKKAAKKTISESSSSESSISEDDAPSAQVKMSEATNKSRKKNAVTEGAHKESAWKTLVKYAAEIKPYEGELNLKGYLHSTIGFLPTFAKAFGNDESNPSTGPQDPTCKILKMMAPKLNEVARLRRFKLQNFDMGPRYHLDMGRFGEIRRITFMNEDSYAIKRIVDHSDPLKIFKEVHTIIHLQNKRIVNLFGAFHEQGVTNLVTELHQGTVRHHLNNISEKQKIRFMIQLIEAVEFIHDRDILHCGLNPESCFITSQNNLVIGDFSDSQLLPKYTHFLKTSNNVVLGEPMYNDSLANRGFYSKATDCFSLGATIFEIETSQALMGYGTDWTDVPLLEYVEVAEKGRLRIFPPIDEQGKIDGIREPLYDRINTLSVMFGKVVWDLVKDVKKRKTARDILEDYRTVFNGLLNGVKWSRGKLDRDLKLGNVIRSFEVTPPLSPSSMSEKLSVVMDMIYFDANLNFGNLKSDTVTENRQILLTSRLDQFKLDMDNLYSKLTAQVKQMGATSAEDSTAKLTFEMMNEALKNSKIDVLETIVGSSLDIPSGKLPVPVVSGTATVVEHSVSSFKSTKKYAAGAGVKKRKVTFKNAVSKGKATGSAPKPTARDRPNLPLTPKPAQSKSKVKEPPTGKTNMLIRSPTRKEDRGNPASDGKLMRKKPRAQENKANGAVEKRGQKRKTGEKVGKCDDEQTLDHESSNQETTGKKVKEDEGCQGGSIYLPQNQRPPPAAPKNLPSGFYETNGLTRDWRGYFDCHVCKRFWNVDRKLVQEHIAQCFKAKQEEKARKKEKKESAEDGKMK